MSSVFQILKVDPKTKARAGLLHTPHGVIETPVFMPVGTLGSVKGVTQEMLEELGAQIILGNTYHLYLRPGHELIRDLGGLHRFISWKNAILTDSGGFQVFSLSKLRKIEEQGVTFRSHLDGSAHFFSPESTVEIQNALGSDIQMQLDECTPYPVSHEAARKSMELSVRWAARAKNAWLKSNMLKTPDNPSTLFPIVQGSMFADLRRESAERLVELDLPGYAIGGLSVGEPRPLTFDMVAATEPSLPAEKPRYVMGVGMPEEIPEYVAQGVDMMDCVLPTRNARNGMLFTSHGRMHIGNAKYARDQRPPDEKCACSACRRYTRAYLRHLFHSGEMLAGVLNTIHNLYFYLDAMRRMRRAILAGEFSGYLSEIRSRVDDESN